MQTTDLRRGLGWKLASAPLLSSGYPTISWAVVENGPAAVDCAHPCIRFLHVIIPLCRRSLVNKCSGLCIVLLNPGRCDHHLINNPCPSPIDPGQRGFMCMQMQHITPAPTALDPNTLVTFGQALGASTTRQGPASVPLHSSG